MDNYSVLSYFPLTLPLSQNKLQLKAQVELSHGVPVVATIMVLWRVDNPGFLLLSANCSACPVLSKENNNNKHHERVLYRVPMARETGLSVLPSIRPLEKKKICKYVGGNTVW